jgi:hypothetical protein
VVNYLSELVERMQQAAAKLQQGTVVDRAWAAHLLVDAKSLALMSQTVREPEPVVQQMSGVPCCEREYDHVHWSRGGVGV